MSGSAANAARVSLEPEGVAGDWLVRSADPEDAPAVAAAVSRLLTELGADPPALDQLVACAADLLDRPDAAVVLLAESDGQNIGVLSASLQEAIHIPGRYAIIQDLWVEPAWRGRLVGAGLVERFVDAALAVGAKTIEVGLPKARFRGLEATEAFYRANGFTLVGSRVRRVLT